jgi:hypothetical protein
VASLEVIILDNDSVAPLEGTYQGSSTSHSGNEGGFGFGGRARQGVLAGPYRSSAPSLGASLVTNNLAVLNTSHQRAAIESERGSSHNVGTATWGMIAAFTLAFTAAGAVGVRWIRA